VEVLEWIVPAAPEELVVELGPLESLRAVVVPGVPVRIEVEFCEFTEFELEADRDRAVVAVEPERLAVTVPPGLPGLGGDEDEEDEGLVTRSWARVSGVSLPFPPWTTCRV
jgi:hypothetical protein